MLKSCKYILASAAGSIVISLIIACLSHDIKSYLITFTAIICTLIINMSVSIEEIRQKLDDLEKRL